MKPVDISLWLFFKVPNSKNKTKTCFPFKLTECTVRIYEKKHFTLQICWKNLFVSYRKNKKGFKNTLDVCLRTSQLRRCRDTGAWSHHVLFFRQQELFPSCTIITAADPNHRASSNLSHRARRGAHLSLSPPEGNRKQKELLPLRGCVSSSKCCHLGWLCSLDSNIKSASGIQLWGVTSANTGALVCPACLWICCLCWKSEVQLDSNQP